MTTTVAESPPAPPAPEPRRPRPAPVRTPAGPVPPAVVGVLVAAAGIVGFGILCWFAVHTPSNADEGVAGIIAQHALHGHFQAFFGGQSYGGTAEPMLVALAFAVFGPHIVVARAVLIVLDLLAAVLVWRITLRIVGVRSVAALAGALAWCGPAVTLQDTVRFYGFRGVTVVCGLVALLLAVRIHDGRRDWPQFALLGLAAGVGWWSSPEIAYYAVPVVVLLALGVVRTPPTERARWFDTVAVLAVAFIVGAFPWIWANVRSRLASLDTAQLTTHRPAVGYVDRLRLFVDHVLPMELGVTRADDGRSLLGSDGRVVLVVLLAVVVTALVLCLRSGGAAAAVAAGVLAFPFLYAWSPASWAWGDGRYAVYLPTLLAVVLGVGATEAVRRVGLPRAAGSWLMAGTLRGHRRGVPRRRAAVVSIAPVNYTATWGDPDAATAALVDRMEAAGVRSAYANYWVAYKLDFVGRGGLAVTTAGFEFDRFPSIADRVAVAADPGMDLRPTRRGPVGAHPVHHPPGDRPHRHGHAVRFRGPPALAPRPVPGPRLRHRTRRRAGAPRHPLRGGTAGSIPLAVNPAGLRWTQLARHQPVEDVGLRHQAPGEAQALHHGLEDQRPPTITSWRPGTMPGRSRRPAAVSAARSPSHRRTSSADSTAWCTRSRS